MWEYFYLYVFAEMGSEVKRMLRFNNNSRKASASLFVVLFALGLLVGGLGTYYINTLQINKLNRQVSDLQSQVSCLRDTQNQTITNQTITIYQNGTSLVDIYANVSDSVVLLHGTSSENSVKFKGQGLFIIILVEWLY